MEVNHPFLFLMHLGSYYTIFIGHLLIPRAGDILYPSKLHSRDCKTRTRSTQCSLPPYEADITRICCTIVSSSTRATQVCPSHGVEP